MTTPYIKTMFHLQCHRICGVGSVLHHFRFKSRVYAFDSVKGHGVMWGLGHMGTVVDYNRG